MTDSLHQTASGECYFACRLRHTLAMGILDTSEEAYAHGYRRKHLQFLSCLLNPRDERVTYDLRVISEPDPAVPSRGRLTIALLCRMTGVEQQAARVHADHVSRLLTATFDEHAFELLDGAEVPALLCPFPVRHLVTITRRAGLEALDTLRTADRVPRHGVGFASEGGTVELGHSAPVSQTDVFHIYQYLPTVSSFNALFRAMLLEPSPIAISSRLQPTTLTLGEVRFLEDQIARAERAAQVGLQSLSDDLALFHPTLQERARQVQAHHARLLFGLKDNAGVATLEAASTRPLPVPVVDLLASLTTEPAGGGHWPHEASTFLYLAGGYEVIDRSSDAAARDAFVRAEVRPPPHPTAPAEGTRLVHLFDTVEACAAFRLPPATADPPQGLEVLGFRVRPPPRNLPASGCLAGSDADGTQQIRLAQDDRRRHAYVVGQTGTGKSTLLRTMILDDIRAGAGVCVIDPHGDLFKDLLGLIPEDRVSDTVVIDPTDLEYPVGLNLLECEDDAQRHFVVQELVDIVTRILEDEYGAKAGEYAGPVFFQHMRMNLLLATSAPDDPGTLAEFYAIYQSKDYWRRWLPLRWRDPLLDAWVKNVLPEVNYTKTGSEGLSMGGYVGSKFEGFVFDPLLRRIFAQKRSTIDVRRLMDDGKIILVNLAKGELSSANSRFFGMVLLAKLMGAALGRANLPVAERRDYYLYVDEFQSFATQSFVTLLSEARKFGLSLVLANQFVAQIRDHRIPAAIFGNVGTLVCFRLGHADAEIMERELQPVFAGTDLVSLPNWCACISTLIEGQHTPPFTLRTLLERTPSDPDRAAAVRAASRARYGRPGEDVDRELAGSLGG